MRIDSHQHFWKYDPEQYSWIDASMKTIQRDFLPSDLKPILSEHGIDGSIAVQADQSEAETEFLLDLAAQKDFIKGVVGWVDLNSDAVEERLKYFAENPLFKGVRHTVWDEKGEFMLKPSFQKGIAALSKFNLTYDILVFHYQMASAVELVEKFPKQKFVLDHMGKPTISSGPSEEWIFQIRKMARQENISCKISGVFSETEGSEVNKEVVFPFLDVLINSFGTERLMFGSDWPVCLTSTSYTEVLDDVESYFSDFSEIEKMNVFGNNAARFYNLTLK